MMEEEWNSSNPDLSSMIVEVLRHASDRQLRLLAVACLHRLEKPRLDALHCQAAEHAELLADGRERDDDGGLVEEQQCQGGEAGEDPPSGPAAAHARSRCASTGPPSRRDRASRAAALGDC